MKTFLLAKIISSDRIDGSHYCMFHGESALKSGAYTTNPSHYLHEDLTDIVCLSRNGRIIPPIFMPDTSLIVSQAIREKLEDLPHVVFLDVEFKKLIDFPYQAGDFSYYDSPVFRRSPRKADPAKLIKRLPDVPRLHAKVGRYFELVVAHRDQIAADYPEATEVSFEINYLADREHASHKLCSRMLSDYPVLRIFQGVLMRDDVFERISDQVDRDYFSVEETTIV